LEIHRRALNIRADQARKNFKQKDHNVDKSYDNNEQEIDAKQPQTGKNDAKKKGNDVSCNDCSI